MTSTNPISTRHPLGLPPGSVRALLVLMILGLFWMLTLLPADRGSTVPLYLYYLVFLSLGSYFAAHGYSIGGAGRRSPLFLPKGSIRFLIVLGFALVLGWKYYLHQDFKELFNFKPPRLDPQEAFLPALILAAFFVGIFVSKVLNKIVSTEAGTPAWFQDIQAWLAILATMGLVAEGIIHGFINPSLPEEKRIYIGGIQVFLAAVTGFYFGARS